jgi:hypothetical protein
MPRELNREQKRALESFANAMNDHDPRERLLRQAAARAKAGAR